VPLRVSAICGLLAPITLIAGWLLGGLAEPDAYSVVDYDISDLGALTADTPWLYNQLGANLTGLLLLALALGLWKTVGTSLAGRIGVAAFGVFAVGTFLDGLFRLDCREIDSGCDRFASWHGTAHAVETAFTVLGVFVAVFALARAFKKSPRWHDLWVPTVAAGLAALASLALLSLAGDGLAVRVGTTILFAWVALVSYRLLRIAQELTARVSSALANT
jgi:Protein of unknown function (DUF998)